MIRDFILTLKNDGKTIFINMHNLDETQRICDRIGILKTKLLAVSTKVFQHPPVPQQNFG